MNFVRTTSLLFALALTGVPACNDSSVAVPPEADPAGGKADDANGKSLVVDVRVTVLSTHVADFWGGGHDDDDVLPDPDGDGHTGDPQGHEGWAALVEVELQDGSVERILFDAGSRADIVLSNAETLGMTEALTSTNKVMLSHWHYDHIDGLAELRNRLKATNPAALQTLYVPELSLAQRDVIRDGEVKAQDINGLQAQLDKWAATFDGDVTPDLQTTGVEPTEVVPGMWLSGFVPRRSHDTPMGALEESSYPGVVRFAQDMVIAAGTEYEQRAAAGDVDTVPDSQSLFVDGPDGVVVMTGCGHAGVANIVRHARDVADNEQVASVIGGLHLWGESVDYIQRVGLALRSYDVQQVMGGHCTGINPVYILRESMEMSSNDCTVASVGFGYNTARGGIRLGQVNAASE